MTSSNMHFTHDALQKVVYELLTQLSQTPSTSRDDKSESNIRGLTAHLTQLLEKRIEHISDSESDSFEEEWVVLVWSLLTILSRVANDADLVQNLNHLLVALVNRAKPIRAPKLLPESELHWPAFYQSFNETLHVMHELYSQLDNPTPSIEPKLNSFCEHHLRPCLDAFRQMCRHHAVAMHTQLRISQVGRMCQMSKLPDDEVSCVTRYYTNCLYILGLLAARLQGFRYECTSSPGGFFAQPETIHRMMEQVMISYEQLLNDALMSTEPSTSSILVTNNLFAFNCSTLSRALIFKQFDVQIVSEDTALAIQNEMIKVRCGQKSANQPSSFPSAALLAMKPTTGVKRNNATANATGGGNTAHKKSDVNSKESVCLLPTYSEKSHAWQASYPHLLCTTRQKDTVLLDSRSGQIGKRPLFYFYIRSQTFSPTGGMFCCRTLSLPFTIATRRNQDCQVQRMMSSYTATCFWLYGTCSVDGLLLHWNDSPLPWSRFKKLCCQHFTVNAEVKRRMEESDFDILEDKMQCDECNEYAQPIDDEKLISFKNVLCPHLRFETNTTSMRFSVWRGVLEVLQIFQEQKSNAKTLWDDYLMHGFLDTDEVTALLAPHSSCLIVRLTYIMGGSICVTVRGVSGEVVHLEPIELKKLQAKSILEYLADIAESAKIDYIMSARHELLPMCDVIAKYKIGADVTRVHGVTSNVSHLGDLERLHMVKFTPLRVAVVTCREQSSVPSTPTYHPLSLPPAVSNGSNAVVNTASPSFYSQLESLMKMYGKSPREVCEMMSYAQGPAITHDVYPPMNPYLEAPSNYEYC